MTTVLIALAIIIGIILIGYGGYRYSAYRTGTDEDYSDGAYIPEGPITRDMKDPLSRAMWVAMDSGQPVIWNAGDKNPTILGGNKE